MVMVKSVVLSTEDLMKLMAGESVERRRVDRDRKPGDVLLISIRYAKRRPKHLQRRERNE